MRKSTLLGLLMWVLALEWGMSAWGKFVKPDFINNISATLQTFAGKTLYAVYGAYLENVAIPNAHLFGQLVRYGEALVALALVGTGAYLLLGKFPAGIKKIVAIFALAGGLLMNINYYLSTSWSGPAALGVNLVMGLVEIILICSLLQKERLSA